MNDTEVLTLGEAMRLLLAEPGVALRRAHHFTASVAGAEANVSVGLARLGHRVRWLSRVGDDASGAAVLSALRAEGVDVSGVEVDPAGFTGLLMRDDTPGRGIDVQYHRTGSAASAISPAYVREAGLAGARLVLVSGITAMLSLSAREAVLALFDLARTEGATIAFDPNVRLKLASPAQWRETVGPLLHRADLVFAGEDELDLLDASARDLVHAGVGTVVVKQRDKVARAVTAEYEWTQDTLVTHVVDPVGAGDALTSGYLSAWLRGGAPAEALLAGAVSAALVVGTRTDLEGLPNRAELARTSAALSGGEEVHR
ncbi:sugar kinase [Amycolatopsis sp. FDAARGOS 1241]|uniref:sugar kinase n=1 Tax=Amycolatopsis sp. FDAARGOS 1241 TaxID=2778070 RepID=UPI0019506758|nr:sugar kinase [Amycolatopsis sp. FDAARGOS 1241]QRP46309.1 sugar kinase [Amycolatopsis sp. FDAARGOS 1241]